MEKMIQYEHTFYDELGIFKVIKTGILGRTGHLFRMQELDPCRQLTLLKPEDARRVRRWLESAEADLRNMGVRNCRRLKAIWEKPKVYQGLKCQMKKKRKKPFFLFVY